MTLLGNAKSNRNRIWSWTINVWNNEITWSTKQWSTKSKITVNKNGENVPHLLLTELVLVHCHFVNNDYQQDSRVLYIFVPNKSFGELLDISPKKFIFLKAFDSELSYIEVWFINQNPKPLEIYKINIALVINQKVKYKK